MALWYAPAENDLSHHLKTNRLTLSDEQQFFYDVIFLIHWLDQ